MSEQHSITTWIGKLKDGEPAAAQPLWERYFAQLIGLARDRLRGTRIRSADEEDVVVAAFDSFFRAAEANRFPRLENRDDLWQVLVMLCARKSVDLCRAESRRKRGGGQGSLDGETAEQAIQTLLSREPDPALAALMVEEYELRIAQLEDPDLQRLARLKMEGLANEEIAGQLDCSLRTVERRLGLIRGLWKDGGSGPEVSSEQLS